MDVNMDLRRQIKDNFQKCNNEMDSVRIKILYNMSKNAVIEEKKQELTSLFQSALNNFKKSDIGSKYEDDGWLKPPLIKDGLHHIILNSSTCKKIDEIFDDYNVDYIIFFSECCDDYSSPMYLVLTAYKYLCQIEEAEKRQIDNDVLTLESILGPYIVEQIKDFQANNETYIYNSEQAERYKKLWYVAKSNAIKFYTEKGKIGRMDYKNIRLILDIIDKVFSYYINGPKKINIDERDKAKTFEKKSL